MSLAAVVSGLTPSERWEIVLARDRRYDGLFVYAVRSTGIYCRPTCPSRRPRRDQVTFFGVPEAAEQAGYRPCKRCRPAALNGAAGDPRVVLVREACRYIDAHADTAPDLGALSARLGARPAALRRAFLRVLGISPRQYRDARRVSHFKTQLRRRRQVSPALYEAGYGSSSRVYERSDAELGMTPATYARGGKGARIRYAVVPCPLGRLLVAATDRGVSRVSLGDDAAALEADLRREFPAAEIRRDQDALGRCVDAILAYLDGREPALDLPLDIRATAFQRRVWSALRRIPRGSTRSYGEIARAIGRPRATRAVARACASNPAALVIPCHRVVSASGDIGGYRWGLERKKMLLETEAAGSRD